MGERMFQSTVVLAGGIFLVIFLTIVVPPLLVDGDVLGAFAAGFVNPYAAGYSSDVLACFVILAAWILYERQRYGVRHGLWCIPLSVVPGVAVGFAAYLLIRMRQVES